MKELFITVKALVYATGFVALWGWVVGAALRLDRAAGRTLAGGAVLHAAGYALVAAGGSLALSCVVLFVVRGEGTPAPFDAPRRFVAAGPYRFVRNPMYVGAITLIVGFGLVLDSPSVFGVALAALFFSNLFVVLVEEPGLARRFGESYLAYKRATNRWVPRVPRAA